MTLSARCLHSSMFIYNQQFLLAQERCCPPNSCANGTLGAEHEAGADAQGMVQDAAILPSSLLLLLGQDFLLADGSGLQHYLIATYLWQSHIILFHQGKKPFAGGWTCEWEVVMSRFSSAQ